MATAIKYSSAVPVYLAAQREGNDSDHRSPLFNKAPRESIRDRLMHHTRTGIQLIDELEEKESGKLGPYSIKLPYYQRVDDVLGYFEPKIEPGLEPFIPICEYWINKFQFTRSLRPYSLETVYASSTKSTNWGLPHFQKGTISGPEQLKMAHAFEYFVSIPSVLGWRGFPSGPTTTKQRVVWMYPHFMVLNELRFQNPLLLFLRSYDEFAAWNDLEVVDLVITRLMNKGPCLSFDASRFDQSISRSLIKAAFYILKAAFQVRYHEDIDHIEKYFSTSGILTPSGTITGRVGSVPSGSGLTNLIDSFVNIIIASYSAVRNGVGLDELHLTVLGDDGVWFWPGIDEKNGTEYLDEIGIKANPEKQFFHERACTFLQRLHLLDYQVDGVSVGVRSLMRTLNGMMSHERIRPQWNTYMESVRWIMQLEQCSSHPNFRAFLNDVKFGDNLRLGLKLNGGVDELFKLAGGASKAREVLRLKAFPHKSRDPRGFKTFKTYHELMN